uniref:Troponin C, skeletal muscle n=1 Tax=Eptatretus burgeri TaxID=7764 RepID=A0A8C4QB05_EPTBU
MSLTEAQEDARSYLTEEQIVELKATFRIFDRDGGGHINTGELVNAIRTMELKRSRKELNAIIKKMDEDGSGTIDFEEFLVMMVMQMKEDKKASAELSEQQVSDAFCLFDRNADGFIDHDDLKEFLMSIGESVTVEEVDEILAERDRNKNGKLDFDDFLKMMKNVSVTSS